MWMPQQSVLEQFLPKGIQMKSTLTCTSAATPSWHQVFGSEEGGPGNQVGTEGSPVLPALEGNMTCRQTIGLSPGWSPRKTTTATWIAGTSLSNPSGLPSGTDQARPMWLLTTSPGCRTTLPTESPSMLSLFVAAGDKAMAVTFFWLQGYMCICTVGVIMSPGSNISFVKTC